MSVKRAVLCYVIKDGKVLMIRGREKYAPHYQLWNGLGGKYEPEDGEDPIICLRRELAVEGGIVPLGLDRVGTLRVSGLSEDVDWVVDLYRAYDYEGSVLASSREGDLRWFDMNRPEAIDTLLGDQYFLPWVFCGRYFEATVLYERGTFLTFSCVFTPQTSGSLVV
ncbi:MAG: NUDIX domain-containing protein [Candidatus Magasanikbacteria bacterium]|nr:NUDIX domain-containing protein [Candidatus Magasanikbacteria bacterium]